MEEEWRMRRRLKMLKRLLLFDLFDRLGMLSKEASQPANSMNGTYQEWHLCRKRR